MSLITFNRLFHGLRNEISGMMNDVCNAESLVVTTGNFEVIGTYEDVLSVHRLCGHAINYFEYANERDKEAFFSRLHVVYYTVPKLYRPWNPRVQVAESEPIRMRGSVDSSHLSRLRDVQIVFTDFPKSSLDVLFREYHADLVDRFASLRDEEEKRLWVGDVKPNIDPVTPLLGSENEATCRTYFENAVWEPNARIFHAAGYLVNFNCREDPKVRPDLKVEDETGRCLTFVEMKNIDFKNVFNEDGTLDWNDIRLITTMKQGLDYALYLKVDIFFISCFTHTLMIEVNLDSDQIPLPTSSRDHGEDKEEVEINVRYTVIKIEDPVYTLQAVIAAIVFRRLEKIPSTERTDKLETAMTKPDLNSGPLDPEGDVTMTDAGDESGGSEVVITRNNVAAVLNLVHEGFSHAFKIKEKDVPTLFPKLTTYIKGDAILKLWDKRYLEETPMRGPTLFGSIEEILHEARGQFISEVECYQRIDLFNQSNVQQIRIPKLYDYGMIKIAENDEVIYSGNYLLLSAIEEEESATQNAMEDGVEQLKLLHNAGIIHGATAKRNFLIAKDGVHFFDFSLSRIYKNGVSPALANLEIQGFMALFGTGRGDSEATFHKERVESSESLPALRKSTIARNIIRHPSRSFRTLFDKWGV